MSEPKDIFESIDLMIELLTKQIANHRELKKALRIAEQLGVPPKELKGKVSTSFRNGARSKFDQRPWVKSELVITHDGTKYEFPLLMVHKDLWPEDMLKKYEAWQHNVAKAEKHRDAMRDT